MKIYYLDMPRWDATDDNDTWRNVAIFDDREDAEEYLLLQWGIKKKYGDLFITEGEE